jgi:hypothetical protein
VARLTLAIEHNLKDGTLRVLIDEREVLSRAVSAKETKKALVFKGRRGQLLEVIDVQPGQHLIRVEAREKADTDPPRAGVVTATFKKGETRLLEVKIGGRIELEWRE